MNNGTFALNLVPRKPWDKLIQPMDYVEIRASRNPMRKELPIIMRGFVNAPDKNTAFGQTGGPSEPRMSITGQDYTKLLTMWQILYLFTQNILEPSHSKQFTRIINNAAGFGLFANYRIPIFSQSINDWITEAFKNVVDPMMKSIQSHNYPSLPDLLHSFNFPLYPMNGLPVASYTGSVWNLLSYAASPPFGELFVRDESGGPTPNQNYQSIQITSSNSMK